MLKNQRVRLAGIDAPECRTRDTVEKQFGFLAKRFLEEHLGEPGSVCKMRSFEFQRGKFGRILGEFMLCDEFGDERSLNDLMIREHVAVEYHGQSKDVVDEEHLKNREIILSENKYQIF